MHSDHACAGDLVGSGWVVRHEGDTLHMRVQANCSRLQSGKESPCYGTEGSGDAL